MLALLPFSTSLVFLSFFVDCEALQTSSHWPTKDVPSSTKVATLADYSTAEIQAEYDRRTKADTSEDFEANTDSLINDNGAPSDDGPWSKKESNLSNPWPLPILKPTEHSFYSINPTESAGFITRYFKGSKVMPSASLSSSGKAIVVVQYCPRPDDDCITFRFVEDKSQKPRYFAAVRGNRTGTSTLQQEEFVETSAYEWDRVASAAMGRPLVPSQHPPSLDKDGHDGTYSPWIDFHDGIDGEAFDVDKAIADGVKLQKYNFGPLRVPLPGTVYSLELIGGFSEEGDRKLREYAGVGNIDKCRDKEQAIEVGRAGVGFWWKSTYAAPNPKAAADFAVHALGAQRIESPFVKRAAYCPEVEWLIMPDHIVQSSEEQASTAMPVEEQKSSAPSGIMLHFVKNNAKAFPLAKISIDEFAEHQATIRSLNSDIFDEFMYNHVDFRTSSLDPFIARFRKLDLPFIVRKGSGYYAVYVNVPENNFVFKISSSKAPTLVHPQKLDEASTSAT